ncbi:hypothetical protein [Granulicella paludicola]|uniref:hypothetical protein n=1 Tax=Granulicella paludicola TaxID=474951 RepID=UPI0021DF8ADB|nr:hypothetical protein [Granulicella paludicola]
MPKTMTEQQSLELSRIQAGFADLIVRTHEEGNTAAIRIEELLLERDLKRICAELDGNSAKATARKSKAKSPSNGRSSGKAHGDAVKAGLARARKAAAKKRPAKKK